MAAAAFERTATSESMAPKDKRNRNVHKLAQAALKQQIKEAAHPTTVSFDLRQNQALDKARKHRDLVGDRNQFQRTRDLEDAALLDKERNLNKLPQRTFGGDNLEVHQKVKSSRPLSTGDLAWEDDFHASKTMFPPRPKVTAPLVPFVNDRQDWAQRDEVPTEGHRSVKERVSPFLRKPDSMWMLKGKKRPEIHNSSPEADHGASTAESKHKNSTFLGLFKR